MALETRKNEPVKSHRYWQKPCDFFILSSNSALKRNTATTELTMPSLPEENTPQRPAGAASNEPIEFSPELAQLIRPGERHLIIVNTSLDHAGAEATIRTTCCQFGDALIIVDNSNISFENDTAILARYEARTITITRNPRGFLGRLHNVVSWPIVEETDFEPALSTAIFTTVVAYGSGERFEEFRRCATARQTDADTGEHNYRLSFLEINPDEEGASVDTTEVTAVLATAAAHELLLRVVVGERLQAAREQITRRTRHYDAATDDWTTTPTAQEEVAMEY